MTPRGWRALLAALTLLALLAAVSPVASLVVTIWRAPEGALEVLRHGRTWALALRSVVLAIAVTGASLTLATLLAWVLARTRLPGRSLWFVLLTLPVALPSFLIAEAYRRTLGFEGMLGAWLGITLITYPLAMLPIEATLRRCSRDAELAARASGAGPVRAFIVATLPQLVPTLEWTGLLVALYALSDYGAVAMLDVDVLTTAVESRRAGFGDADLAAAAALAALLTLFSLGCLLGIGRIRGLRGPAVLGAHVEPAHEPAALGPWTVGALALCAGTVLVGLAAPVALIGSWWAGAVRAPEVSLAQTLSDVWAPAGRSLFVGLVTAGLAGLAAAPFALMVHRAESETGSGWTRRYVSLAFIGYGLPGVVIGFALVQAALRVDSWLEIGIYQTLTALVAGYFIRCLAEAVGPSSAAALRLPRQRLEAARALGSGYARAWRRIGFPTMAPGVLAGAALAFLTVVKELPITLILRPTGYDTLAFELFDRLEAARPGEAAPFAAVMLLLSGTVVWILVRWSRD